MSIFAIVLLAGLGLIVVYGIMIYNSLVQVKHNVSKAWANIDVLLKQRHDEIPKLVEVCKQYRQFEQDTLHKVIEARSRVFTASQAPNQSTWTTSIPPPPAIRVIASLACSAGDRSLSAAFSQIWLVSMFSSTASDSRRSTLHLRVRLPSIALRACD